MRSWSFPLCTSMLLPACDLADEPLGDTALLVVGEADAGTGDSLIEARLNKFAAEVRVVPAAEVETGDAEADGVGLVFIAASVESTAVMSHLDVTDCAIIVAQPWVAEDFRLVASDAKVRDLNAASAPAAELASWTIVDGEHPAAGGISTGPFEVWSADGQNVVPMIRPPEGATVVAEWGDDGWATLVVWDKGDPAADGEGLRRRRAVFALEPRAPEIFTSTTWDLLEATIAWAYEKKLPKEPEG